MTKLKNTETDTLVLFSSSALSPSFPASFTDDDGHIFGSVSQYVAYSKAMLFNDVETAGKVLASDSFEEYKKLEKTIKGFDSQTWAAAAFSLVYQANFMKFGQNPHLFQILAETKDKTLGFADKDDSVWGTGCDAADPRAADPARWKGKNLFGQCLSALRQDFLDMDFKPPYTDKNRFVITLYDEEGQRMLYFSMSELSAQLGISSPSRLAQHIGSMAEDMAHIYLEKQGVVYGEDMRIFMERNEETLFAAAVKDADPKTYAGYTKDPHFKKKFGY